MSSKFHEAYCIDAMADRLFFYDDFLGDSVRDLWAAAGTGSAAVVDAQDGGIVRLTTGATDTDNYRLWWGNIASLLVSKKVTMEFRLKIESTSDVEYQLRLYATDTEFIEFEYDTAAGDTTWRLSTRNGGATTDVDSGIAPETTSYHIFRIECFPTNEVHFYIDGVECGNSPITTNIPDDAADYLEPFLWIRTRTAATKSMDIDYVTIRQEI